MSNTSAWIESGPVAIQAVRKNYHLGGQLVATRRGDEVYFIHADHLGSTSLTTNISGTVVAQTRYLPYGEQRWTAGGAQPTDFTFTGQRREGFGLMDYQSRHYNPRLGRFISPDSIVPNPGNPQNLNRYSYVNGNPVKFVDPSGHQQEPWWQKIIGDVRDWWLTVTMDACGVSGCVGVPEVPGATDTVKTIMEGFQDRYLGLPGEPMIGPEDLEHIQQFVEAFQAVEGGVRSWNEFQHAAEGSFVGKDRDKANIGWRVYQEANQSDDILVIGRQPDTASWASEEGYQILDLPGGEWGMPVNDSWVQGGIDRGATFRLVSPINNDTLWDKRRDGPRVFARELEQLRQAGYTYFEVSEDERYMLPPK